MNLADYIKRSGDVQGGDKHHDSLVRYLSNEETLKSLGIDPPYHAIGFEVRVSNNEWGGIRRCDLAVLNHELTIVEVKVIRSLNLKIKTIRRRIREINNQLRDDYSFFNRERIGIGIRLMGAYRLIDSQTIHFYNLPPCGSSIDDLEILQIPCL